MFKFVSERRIRNKEFKYWKQTELDDIIRRLHDIGITPEDVEMEKVLTDAKDAIVRRGVAPEQSIRRLILGHSSGWLYAHIFLFVSNGIKALRRGLVFMALG